MAVATEKAPAEQRFLLRNISWRTYETFLAELGERPIRLTYDRGNLELMAPSYRHESWAYLLARFVDTLAEELSIPFKAGRTTTFKREDLERGLEPDDCFYFANVALILGKTEIDLACDPAPDLALEIDITSSSLDRLSIYAALRVGEVWRFDGQALQVYRLRGDGSYEQCQRSPTFPGVPLARLVEFLLQATETDDMTLLRAFRAWVRQEVVPRTDEAGNGAPPA
jgi:Uma2 family endonuclease